MNHAIPYAAPSERALATRSVLSDELDDAALRNLGEILDHAAALFGETAVLELDRIDDFSGAAAALSRAWDFVMHALRTGGRAADTVMAAPTLVGLLDRIGASQRSLAEAERRRQESMFTRARDALSSIQELTSVSRLVEEAPRALCRIGFDRALLSSVEYSTWLTDSAHIDEDEEWAQAIVDAGRSKPQAIIPGLPETDIVRRHQPILVEDAHTRRDVHTAVVDAAAGRSYVAAAIMPRSKVVGFLHCDRIFHRSEVTEFDANVLGLFAQGYSFAIERAITLRDLDELRGHVRGFTQGIESFVRMTNTNRDLNLEHRASTTTTMGAFDTDSRTQPRDPGLSAILTRRELEVLSHMAEGDNNQRIAARLVIAEETVKSHVKSILRKLRVSSRVEAVARWHHAMNAD